MSCKFIYLILTTILHTHYNLNHLDNNIIYFLYLNVVKALTLNYLQISSLDNIHDSSNTVLFNFQRILFVVQILKVKSLLFHRL